MLLPGQTQLRASKRVADRGQASEHRAVAGKIIGDSSARRGRALLWPLGEASNAMGRALRLHGVGAIRDMRLPFLFVPSDNRMHIH